jgi:hypothetical protein
VPLKVQNGVPIVPPVVEPGPALGIAPPPVNLLDLNEVAFESGVLAAAPATVLGDLGIRLVRQVKDNWCWAACAEMVLNFFDMPKKKCEVAQDHLQLNNAHCCDFQHNEICDVAVEIDEITDIYNNETNVTADRLEHALSFAKVQEQIIEKRKPIEVHISWGVDNGSHVILIEGCYKIGHVRYAKIKDPLYGSADIRFSDLWNYQRGGGTGQWVGTWLFP